MKEMKNKTTAIIAVMLVIVIACSSTGMLAYKAFANGGNKNQSQETLIASDFSKNNDAADIINSKDETVYVLANADGTVKKLIVSDWIRNVTGSDIITDVSQLNDVTNVNGDETYTMENDNALVWDAQGNDIYFRGSIEKNLPVDITISYKIDGQPVTAEELAGMSGRVSIRFDYKNNQYEYADIDGDSTEIYVPFVMLTGVKLDNNIFTNIEVSNGKIVNDGDRTFVMGLALPGLRENLNLETDTDDIPDYVEISADAKNFAMDTTLTFATNVLFHDLDFDDIGGMDDLSSSMSELNEAMEDLIDGSSQLYDGLCTLLDKSGELASGVNQLAAGAKALSEGAGSLETGTADLKAGMDSLLTGMNNLASNNENLIAGSKQVFESLLAMADTQLEASGIPTEKLTIENYAPVLEKIEASLTNGDVHDMVYNKALSSVTSAVREQESYIRTQVEAKVQEQVTEKVIFSALNMSVENYNAAVSAGKIPAENRAQISAAIDVQMQSDDVQAMIHANTEKQIQQLITQKMESSEVRAQIDTAVKDAASGADKLSTLKSQLDSYNEFYKGLLAYTAGVTSAADGASQLCNGSGQLASGAKGLSDGAETLNEGLVSLQKGVNSLEDGVSKLADGAMKLSDGLKEFNEKGIQKLIETFDGDIGQLIDRLNATVDASKSYKSFSGISGDMDGTVKFIYRTDPIENNQNE